MSVEMMLERKGEPGLSVYLLPGALYPKTLMRLAHPLTSSKPLKSRANKPSLLFRKALVDVASDKGWS